MNKKITLNYALIITALAVLLTFMITSISVDRLYNRKLMQVAKSEELYRKLTDLDNIVRKEFIGKIDDENLSDAIISGYIQGLGDKYSTYLPKEQFAALQLESQGQIAGIGINVVNNNKLKVIEVTSIMEDSPAERAGILSGDIITHIDDTYIPEIGYYAAIAKFPRTANKTVDLIVRRGSDFSEELRFTLVTEIVVNPSVKSEMLVNNTALISIRKFDKTTASDFKKAMSEMRDDGALKYIFDVRNNPGGDLQAIVDVLDYLLPEGNIVTVVSGDGKEKIYKSDASCFEAPMAVLISKSTASAAELFSAALRDYKKAVLVGETTYGKGTVQTILGLTDDTGVSISVAMYNPPSGINYEGVGVSPDIQASLTEDQLLSFYKLTHEEDSVLQAAITAIS